tara:strand:- start:141 stop:596 length:456 start_codon:yes stop_codon:yes gene_type:complete
MNLRIIQLGIEHTDACIELDQKSLKGLWTRSQWEKELSDPMRVCFGVSDHGNNSLIGICSSWLAFDELHLTSIAVHPFYQRRGIAKFILSELIRHSESKKIKLIHLEVKEKNVPAKALYKSMGFKVKRKRSNFYKDGSNALVFVKELIYES